MPLNMDHELKWKPKTKITSEVPKDIGQIHGKKKKKEDKNNTNQIHSLGEDRLSLWRAPHF